MTARRARGFYNNFIALRAYLIKNKDSIEPRLDMATYGNILSLTNVKCNTCGCILGNSISIPKFRKTAKSLLRGANGAMTINFAQFSKKLFDLEPHTSNEWDDLFGVHNSNNIDEFLKRLDIFLAKAYPEFHTEISND